MMFLTGADELNKIDIVIFPKTYAKYPNIQIGDILYIKGKVEKRLDKYQIIAMNLKKLN